MPRPVRGELTPLREDVMCEASFVSIREHPPFHTRRGLATIRPRVVDRVGEARLLCDGLHDGEHVWPALYQPTRVSDEDPDDPAS